MSFKRDSITLTPTRCPRCRSSKGACVCCSCGLDMVTARGKRCGWRIERVLECNTHNRRLAVALGFPGLGKDWLFRRYSHALQPKRIRDRKGPGYFMARFAFVSDMTGYEVKFRVNCCCLTVLDHFPM